MGLNDKVINLIKCLLEEGETSIAIYMHSNDAIVITDGAIEKRHHIYCDEERKDECRDQKAVGRTHGAESTKPSAKQEDSKADRQPYEGSLHTTRSGTTIESSKG